MLPLFGRIDRTSRLVATAWCCMMFIVKFATVETKFSRDTLESGSQAVLPLGHLQPAHVWLLHRHRNVQECLILSNEKMNQKKHEKHTVPKPAQNYLKKTNTQILVISCDIPMSSYKSSRLWIMWDPNRSPPRHGLLLAASARSGVEQVQQLRLEMDFDVCLISSAPKHLSEFSDV